MLRVWLAEPRGFCAGVRRAVNIVEESLQKFGSPVYVRHEIVHNKHVIDDLRQKGAIFIDEIDQVPDGYPVIFSAHGVSQSVEEAARARNLQVIDATCPLVAKVHQQVRKYAAAGMQVVVIGKSAHPEVEGTVGQAVGAPGVHVINTLAEVLALPLDSATEVGFVTQTTLSVDDTSEIVAALKQRFPSLNSLKKDDICFATTNRQAAVKAIAQKASCVVVIGSKNSSNSRQLREVALQNGAAQAFLIDDVSELDWSALSGVQDLGISAGASAPEYLIEDLLASLSTHYDKIKIQYVIISQENVEFKH